MGARAEQPNHGGVPCDYCKGTGRATAAFVAGPEFAAAVEGRYEVTPSGCWEWTGPRNGQYGRVTVRGQRGGRRWFFAHRVMDALHHGPIPAGVKTLHSCDNPLCGNPEHLFRGTQKQNVDDMLAKGRGLRGRRRVVHPGARITGPYASHLTTPESP